MINHRKNQDWWAPRERIDNALRRYARDYFQGNEKNLPLTHYAYRNAIPDDDRRKLLQQWKWYPPFLAVMRHYGSLFEAWKALGFAVEWRRGKTRAYDLAGVQFGWLTALEYAYSAPGSSRVWKCRCRCGRETFVAAKNLIRGKSVSCGCYSRLVVSRYRGFKLFRNIAGEKFGRLTARRPVGKYQNQTLWECECECGKKANVPVASLTTGATRSCGCLRTELSQKRLKNWRKNLCQNN